MSTLADWTAAPTRAEEDGPKFRAAPLTLAELGELERHLRAIPWQVLFRRLASEYGWTPEQVARLTPGQALALLEIDSPNHAASDDDSSRDNEVADVVGFPGSTRWMSVAAARDWQRSRKSSTPETSSRPGGPPR